MILARSMLNLKPFKIHTANFLPLHLLVPEGHLRLKRASVMKNQSLSFPSHRVEKVAKDVMSTRAVPLKIGQYEPALASQFLSGQYEGWPVVDRNGQLVGVLRELRLLQALSVTNSLDRLQVEDIMTTPPFCVLEDAPLELVLDLMVQQHAMSMPVVSDRYLVGVISRGEILREYCLFSTFSWQTGSRCALCECIQGSIENEPGHHLWTAMEHFLSLGNLNFTGLEFEHTYCPRCLKAIQTLLQKYAPQSEDDMSFPSSASCLLVVDDDTVVSGMLGEAFKGWGYKVCTANHGREALNLIAGRPVDGILLDLDMPVMNGRTMLDELRWLGYEVPVVMMSGGADQKELRQFLNEGAQGFLLKPFTLSILKDTCRRLFANTSVGERLRKRAEAR